MPKATAVWLVENTSLTFDQVAGFCGLHPLEVKGIADGEVAQGIVGRNPIVSGELSESEIARCQDDASAQLTMLEPAVDLSNAARKGPRYKPINKRQETPNAILWLLRSHPELTDGQVSRLVGTTKPTIETIRNRTHWNMQAIKPTDPVSLGLCSQVDLDTAVTVARRRQERKATEARRATARAEKAEAAAAAAKASESAAPASAGPENSNPTE
jgi:hypothetical protein